MQQHSSQIRLEGKSIGFVPTMGFLHEGHLSLIKKSKEKSDYTIVSIFVNPTQFSPNEDLTKYPRDLENDKKLLVQNKVDVLFIPSEKEIYSSSFQTYVEVTRISNILEGKFRPSHFKGVTTIVIILLNCVKPDFAFFGQKDAQQIAVINQMVKDLKLDVEIISSPIIREKDGLAMSSRNSYLSEKERSDAAVLYKALMQAKNLITKGTKDSKKIISEVREIINNVKTSNLDYVNIVNADSFELSGKLEAGKEYYVLTACKIGSTRLIDNIKIKTTDT
jgi:pantoate--beta-alanine ligase